MSKSNMGDGRHCENFNRHTSATVQPFAEIWQGDAYWSPEGNEKLKFNFQQFYMVDSRNLENRKTAEIYSAITQSHITQIWL